MLADDLVTVAKYANGHEASMAKGLLEGHGIHGVVVGHEINNTLWHLGPTIAGVELQVAFSEAPNAAEILDEFRKSESPANSRSWVCPHCGEKVEPGFEICWSCGAINEGRLQPEESTPETVEFQEDEEVPLRSLIADRTGRRVLRATLIGIFFFPPILIYAFSLLTELSEREFQQNGVNPISLCRVFRHGAVTLLARHDLVDCRSMTGGASDHKSTSSANVASSMMMRYRSEASLPRS